MTGGAGEWRAFANGVTGASHVRRGRGREDAHLAHTSSLSFVALSDGHGSARCTRASRGAQLAVDASAAVLGAAVDVPVMREAVEAIVDGWRRRCMEDLLRMPLTDEEREIVSNDHAIGSLLLYGATLLVAVVGDSRVAVCKLGDGDILRLVAGGTIEVLAGAEGVLTETDSLCLPDAVDRTMLKSWDAGDTRLVLVATDGFGSAFESSAWHAEVVRDVMEHIDEHGLADLEHTLGRWCEGPAEVGGDDVSIGLLVRSP